MLKLFAAKEVTGATMLIMKVGFTADTLTMLVKRTALMSVLTNVQLIIVRTADTKL